MEEMEVVQMLASVKVARDSVQVQSYLQMLPAVAATYRSTSVDSQMFHQALVAGVLVSYAQRLCMCPIHD